jgi:hypothetical protein
MATIKIVFAAENITGLQGTVTQSEVFITLK